MKVLRRSIFLCIFSRLEFMKSFEKKSPLLEPTDKSEHSATDKTEASKSDNAPAPRHSQLNTTYDLCPCDDSMKENAIPASALPGLPLKSGGGGSVIVIEEDSGFYIYDNSDIQPADTETKVLLHRHYCQNVFGCSKVTQESSI